MRVSIHLPAAKWMRSGPNPALYRPQHVLHIGSPTNWSLHHAGSAHGTGGEERVNALLVWTGGKILHGASIDNTLPMKPGDSISCGPLVVRSCDLSGHANPALGFHIDGLPFPVLVTGDALFAGSIGGCGTPISINMPSAA